MLQRLFNFLASTNLEISLLDLSHGKDIGGNSPVHTLTLISSHTRGPLCVSLSPEYGATLIIGAAPKVSRAKSLGDLKIPLPTDEIHLAWITRVGRHVVSRGTTARVPKQPVLSS